MHSVPKEIAGLLLELDGENIQDPNWPRKVQVPCMWNNVSDCNPKRVRLVVTTISALSPLCIATNIVDACIEMFALHASGLCVKVCLVLSISTIIEIM
jgi:hypothetical protein